MLTGSCLCGNVRYEITEDIDLLYYCHCSRCRKESGSAFNVVARVDRANFKLIDTGGRIALFSDRGNHRHRCVECGSTLFMVKENAPGTIGLRVGTLDSEIRPKRKVHIFTASMAAWDEICDGNPTYLEWVD